MKKKVIALAAALSLSIVAFSGCKNKSNEKSESVRIALMTTGFTVPINYALNEGYFEELGVDVSVEYFANGPAINEAIASGDIDFAGIGEMPAITGAITNNSKLVGWVCDDEASIQCYARNDSDIVSAGKGNLSEYPEIYGTADTWKGKSVICAKGTSSHYGLLATLEAFGLSENDIELVNMEGSAGAAAFASGTCDIFWGFDPQWAEFYANSDSYTQISTCKNAGKQLGDVLIASEEFCNNRGETLTKVLQAVTKAQEELKNSETAYNDAMYSWQTTYGSCTEDIARYSASIKDLYSSEELKNIFDETAGASIAASSIDVVSQFMVDNGVISDKDKELLKANNPIDYSFLFKAIENLK